jgi:hypothetical protein
MEQGFKRPDTDCRILISFYSERLKIKVAKERVRSCNITNKLILQQTKSRPSNKFRKNDET